MNNIDKPSAQTVTNVDLPAVGETWDNNDETWDEDTTTWDESGSLFTSDNKPTSSFTNIDKP